MNKIPWRLLSEESAFVWIMASTRRRSQYLNQWWACFDFDAINDKLKKKKFFVNYFIIMNSHDDVIKWNFFLRYWPFVRGIHRPPVDSPHKRQWRGGLVFSLICARTTGWVNNRDAGDLRRHGAHYDVILMNKISASSSVRTTYVSRNVYPTTVIKRYKLWIVPCYIKLMWVIHRYSCWYLNEQNSDKRRNIMSVIW